jgi:hypothetical protein
MLSSVWTWMLKHLTPTMNAGTEPAPDWPPPW